MFQLVEYGVLHSLAKRILTWCGWTIKGELPAQPKFILAVAPHTSNWDFFVRYCRYVYPTTESIFFGKSQYFPLACKECC